MPTHVFPCAALALSPLVAFAGCAGSDLGNLSSSNEFEGAEVERRTFDLELQEACGSGGMTADGQDAFRRQPYLQQTTAGSTDILWTTDGDAAATVRVTLPDGTAVAEVVPERDTSADRSFRQLVAHVEELSPDSIYCYEVASDDGMWLDRTGFRTAPVGALERPIRIAALGDLGSRTSDQFAVLDALQQVPFDHVLVTGDLAYEQGTLSDHELNFFQVYQRVLRSVPFFVISGNHDYASDGAVFREVFSLPTQGVPQGDRERWYSMDWGPLHIVALDTEKVGAEQAAWLEADLRLHSDAQWTVAFMHRPAFSSGYHGNTSSVQEWFVPLFEQFAVDLVLAGHDHNYERTSPQGGVTYVVTGSGGRGTRPVGMSGFTAYSEAVAHFSYLEVTEQTLRLTAIDATGAEFDQVVLEK